MEKHRIDIDFTDWSTYEAENNIVDIDLWVLEEGVKNDAKSALSWKVPIWIIEPNADSGSRDLYLARLIARRRYWRDIDVIFNPRKLH